MGDHEGAGFGDHDRDGVLVSNQKLSLIEHVAGLTGRQATLFNSANKTMRILLSTLGCIFRSYNSSRTGDLTEIIHIRKFNIAIMRNI